MTAFAYSRTAVWKRRPFRKFLMTRAGSRFAYVWFTRRAAIATGRPLVRQGNGKAYQVWGSRQSYLHPLEPIPGYWVRGFDSRYQVCGVGHGFYRGKYCR